MSPVPSTKHLLAAPLESRRGPWRPACPGSLTNVQTPNITHIETVSFPGVPSVAIGAATLRREGSSEVVSSEGGAAPKLAPGRTQSAQPARLPTQ